jgi:hypothetical protein
MPGLLKLILETSFNWGFGNNDIFEKVHLKFFKIILHLKVTTPNGMIYGELGRYPLDMDIIVEDIEIIFKFKFIFKKAIV